VDARNPRNRTRDGLAGEVRIPEPLFEGRTRPRKLLVGRTGRPVSMLPLCADLAQDRIVSACQRG